jgi:methyl-accepting chemotaxis protein
MKLQSKFTSLVILLAVLTIAVNLFMLNSFYTFFRVKDFEAELGRAQFEMQKLSTYPDMVLSRSFNFSSLSSDWVEKFDTTSQCFTNLAQIREEIALTKELNTLLDEILELWNSSQSNLNIINRSFINIENMKLIEDYKNRLGFFGITKGISYFEEDTDVYFTIQAYITSLNGPITGLVYTNSSFQTKFTTFSELLNKSIENQLVIFRRLAFSLTLISCSIFAILTFIVTRKIVRRIFNAGKMSTELANRNLAIQIKDTEKDEVGDLIRALNTSFSSLNELVSKIKEEALVVDGFGQRIRFSADNTASASHEIRSNIESLTHQFQVLNNAVDKSLIELQQMSDIVMILLTDNTYQQTAIDETAKSIQNMITSIEKVTSMAVEKASSAMEIQRFVTDGEDKINDTVSLLSDVSSQLGEIGEFVTLINGIADQTNILSMNAAIESAHAGEAGKGFSVVAEEIRVLAESTSENAKRISEAVYTIIQKMENAAQVSTSASDAFSRVSKQSYDMMVSLQDISKEIKAIDENTKTIQRNTDTVSQSAEKITGNCDKLNGQQITVSTQMTQMRDIFTESLNGVGEIKIGAADIVEKMVEVSSLSSESCDKMKELSTVLNEFKTTENE